MTFSPFAALGLAAAALAAPVAVAAQNAEPSAPATAEAPGGAAPAAPTASAPSAPAAPEAAAPAAATDALSLETPIKALMADERAKAAVVKHLPGIDVHPSYEDFKDMTLTKLAPYSNGMITDEKLTLIAADLAALK